MRRWAGPLALLVGAGCNALDPTVAYREAARSLQFHLDRVEPRLELAFPLDRSRLRLQLHLGLENRSGTHLQARSLGGRLSVKVGEQTHYIGLVTFPAGLDLPPGRTSETVAELTFDYSVLKAAWEPLTAVLQRHAAAVWLVEGEARLEILGFPFTVPLRATTHSGNAEERP